MRRDMGDTKTLPHYKGYESTQQWQCGNVVASSSSSSSSTVAGAAVLLVVVMPVAEKPSCCYTFLLYTFCVNGYCVTEIHVYTYGMNSTTSAFISGCIIRKSFSI